MAAAGVSQFVLRMALGITRSQVFLRSFLVFGFKFLLKSYVHPQIGMLTYVGPGHVLVTVCSSLCIGDPYAPPAHLHLFLILMLIF